MKRNILLLISLLVGIGASAQSPIRLTGEKQGTDNQVTVNNFDVASTADKTIVTMDFVLDSLRVPSNRYRAFTPILQSQDGTQRQRMKTLIVSGRTQDILFEREGIDPLYADNCDNVRRLKGQPQTVSYTDAVSAEPWHKGASVLVECDLCGCGDTLRSQLAELGRLLPPDPKDLIALTNATPAPDKGPFTLHGSAFINFVVDRWEMRPDYMNNAAELRKITDTLDIMVRDRNITVDKIKIHGWASPESPYEHNRMLATNRAQSLTNSVRQLYSLPVSAFAPAESTPENWIGLRQAVEEMSTDVLPHKQAILALIDDDTIEPDPKEWRIKQQYPAEYRFLLTTVYPHLRRSDYEITFNIRKFTLDEAVEIYKTRPNQLSLYELWQVANTFPAYSDDYNRALQMAVNIYPESEVAMINLANVALERGDLLKAETLLQRAGTSAEAENARAVLHILQKDYDAAEAALTRAAALGLDVTKNREAIRQLK